MELLKNLTAEEQQQMKDAIAYITILVAGADGNIDEKELSASEKLAQIRSFSFHSELKEFYQEVNAELSEQVQKLITELPDEVDARQQAISTELEKLNAVLAKLSLHHGHIFYDSFVSFAKHVAKSAGGFIGFMSVGAEEKKVAELPMLTPIAE